MYHPKQYRADIVSFDILDRTMQAKSILFLNSLVMFIIPPMLSIKISVQLTSLGEIVRSFSLFGLIVITLTTIAIGLEGYPIKWLLGEMQYKVGYIKLSKHRVSINFEDKTYHFTKDNISELSMDYDYETGKFTLLWGKDVNQKIAIVYIKNQEMFTQFMKIRKVWNL